MLNSFLAADGGQGMYIDFASAQPFVNDRRNIIILYITV